MIRMCREPFCRSADISRESRRLRFLDESLEFLRFQRISGEENRENSVEVYSLRVSTLRVALSVANTPSGSIPDYRVPSCTQRKVASDRGFPTGSFVFLRELFLRRASGCPIFRKYLVRESGLLHVIGCEMSRRSRKSRRDIS